MKFFKPKFWDKNHASFFSFLIFPIALLIKLLFFCKIKIINQKKFSIPIICVGNIYIGGTGKTPTCVEIFSILKKLNKRPSFIRKKYKSFQDETFLQKKIGPVYESKQRANAIDEAIQNKTNVAILDDGFQDFSIIKNLSIVCFNEKQWIGNGFTIPSGPLRENLNSLKRAHCVFINGKKNIVIENQILKINKLIKIYYTKYVPQNLEEFKNKRIICFAGIGNPTNFFNLLEQNKINLIEKIDYPDHYNYSKHEIEKLINKAKRNGAILLTTEKDYLRILPDYKNDIKYLKIKIEIENKDDFIDQIKKIL